jgi:hypothetical protein
MTLSLAQIAQIAYAGQSVVAIHETGRDELIRLAALYDEGIIGPRQLANGIRDALLGLDLAIMPHKHQFERAIDRFELRKRSNARAAYKMRLYRARRANGLSVGKTTGEARVAKSTPSERAQYDEMIAEATRQESAGVSAEDAIFADDDKENSK